MSNYDVGKINKDSSRSACKRCGYAGHLTFQCRNFIKVTLVVTVSRIMQHRYKLYGKRNYGRSCKRNC
ncbi:Protein SREK1IP1 [Operophtera brumata]|uniref:Protein SREK1IP1 n=1 Tax=Operophtera brumata TaxID=104452 RepID=A0A0L7K4I0_OPEBR|nr:Protein SREK1IP1 [Operophtera brumata]